MRFASFLLATFLFPSTPYLGVVVDAATGQPVPDATVQYVMDAGQFEGRLSLNTDGYGRFRLDPEGATVHLRVKAAGYRSADVTRLLRPGVVDTIRLGQRP